MNIKFRKAISVLLAVLMLLSAAVPMALAAGEDHEHNYVKYGEPVPRTCTKAGYTVYDCTVCHTKIYADFIQPEGHKIVDVPRVFPTCTEDGHTDYQYCSVCKEVFKEKIVLKATGHSEHRFTKKATCLEDGYDYYLCDKCDNVRIDEATRIVAPGYHKSDVIIEGTEPTCTENGWSEGYACSTCGEICVKQEYIPAKGHTYIDGSGVVTAPTCTENGYTTYTCDVCGLEFRADFVDALGHDMKWTVRFDPTCINKGVKDGKCDRCGFETVETTPATGHSLVWEVTTPPLCNAEGLETAHCNNADCDYTETKPIAKLPHTDANNDNFCDNCGEIIKPFECKCICHRTGIAKAVYDIFRLFWRIFGIKKTCECGAAHY